MDVDFGPEKDSKHSKSKSRSEKYEHILEVDSGSRSIPIKDYQASMAKNVGTLRKSPSSRNADERKYSRASGSKVSSRKSSKKKRNDKERLVDRFPTERESANLERRRNDAINFLKYRDRESASLGFVRQYRKSLEKSASGIQNINIIFFTLSSYF